MAMLHPFDPSVNKPRPNADGSVSTELTRTVQLPDGSWANVPSLWWGNGSDVKDLGQLTDDQIGEFAARYEQQAGAKFPRFGDLTQAEAAAKSRSAAGGGENGAITNSSATAKKPITLDRLAAGIRLANAKGDIETVKKLGAAYRQMQASGSGAAPKSLEQAAAELGQGERSTNVEWAPGQGPKPPPSVGDQLMNATGATVNGIVNGIPIVGPMAQNVSDAMGGTIAQLTGGDYGQYIDHQKQLRAGYAQAAPLASIGGNLAGGVGAYGALAKVPAMASALGLEGGLLQKVGNSAMSALGIGTADSMARGEKPTDALMQNLLPAGVAGGLPILGAGLRAGGKAIGDSFIKPIATMANRENAVTKAIGGGIAQDKAAGGIMDAATEATAQKAGADVLNADRFGSAIRTLARTAANVSPAADNAFKTTTEQRFLTQGKRAVDFVRSLMGGATDDLALQDQLRTAAQATNKAAYGAAYAAPKAKAIWSPELRNLLTAQPFKDAVKAADEVGANYAAVTGQKAVRNPFVFDEAGNVVGLRQMPGGGTALPNLEFWDIVQRGLRNTAEQAKRTGDNLKASQVGQMRTQLLSVLDGAVPQFKQARQGAASFFGAEDAIDAGRKAVTSTKAVPEIERAVMAMSPAEKDAFSVGFSSEIIDAINASRDRVNVINSIFGSESARKRITIALGPQRAKELEAYVKMEQVLDLLRNATQGNSTTAKQLIAAGLLGTGAGLYTGDASTGFNVATLAYLGRRGLQMAGKTVDDQVMKRVAEILSSPDPALLQRAIQNASLSEAHMDAIDGIMRGLAVTSRGGLSGGQAASEGRGPIQIVVRGGNPALAN